MAKQVSPGVLALRKVVDDVHKEAREAKARGELVGWSSSKFPCELAAAFDLHVMYPENQAAGIAANRYGELMCQAAEDLGYDNDICGYARISLAYAAGVRVSRKYDPETGEYIIDPSTGKPLKDADGNVVKSAQEVMLAAAQKMAATIAKNAPIAVRNCKKAINDGLDADMDQAVVIEEKLFGDCFETEDQKYGMAFFLDKNKEKVKEPFQNK